MVLQNIVLALLRNAQTVLRIALIALRIALTVLNF